MLNARSWQTTTAGLVQAVGVLLLFILPLFDIAITQSNADQVAGAIVLEPNLIKVDVLFHLAQRQRRIALQSAVGGMVLSLIGMGLAAVGLLPPVAGALAQEAIDLVAVLNAVRTALPTRNLSDVDLPAA